MNILFEGKMRALFSMIFGVGIMLFIGEKEKSGRPIAGIFYSRMFWLALFGLFHTYILLSGGDVLYPYALCGMILFFFRNTKPVWLLGGVISLVILEMAIGTYRYDKHRSERITYIEIRENEQRGVPLTDTQIKAKTTWLEDEKWYVHGQEEIDEKIKVMRSQYRTVAGKMRDTLILNQAWRVFFVMVDPMALMLIGMVLFRWGFFSGHLGNKTYAWSLILCYSIGLPLVLYSWNISARFPNPLQFMESNPYNIRIYMYPIQRIFLALGHVSLIILLIRLKVFKGLFNAIAAVGKMAFSNYILQTILCTLIFFGYGLGYFARLEYYQLYFIVIAIWVLQLIVSSLWLRYFRFGPLEWVWRSLTYRRLQPMMLPRSTVHLGLHSPV